MSRFTPPPALNVEWECLGCQQRSPYLLSPQHDADEWARGGGDTHWSGTFTGTSGAGVDEGDGSLGGSDLSSFLLGAASTVGKDTVAARHARTHDKAHQHSSALIPDEEEDSYLSTASIEQWLLQNAGKAGGGGCGGGSLNEQAQQQRQQLVDRERFWMEEALLGKRQMRFCRFCGYARCAEVREALPQPAMHVDVSTPVSRRRDVMESVYEMPPPSPQEVSPSQTQEDSRPAQGPLLPRLPAVVQHWWGKSKATVQRWHSERSSGSSQPATASPSSSMPSPPPQSSAAVFNDSQRQQQQQQQQMGRDMTLDRRDTPPSPSSATLSRDAMWRMYSTEDALWRLVLPAAAAPFLDGQPSPPPTAPTSLTHNSLSEPSTPTMVVATLPQSSSPQRHSPSRNVSGRRLGYRQEVTSALEKLDTVQLNVARMRLEQALQLVAEEEQRRRLSHD